MTIQIRKAERRKAKLRLGIAGPSGAGKTMSALKIAKGISPNGKIVMIDTERGSGDLYADLFEYDIITLPPPYKPDNYVDVVKAAEDYGAEVIIIDSLSHAWSDEGGLLDQADKLSARGNSYTVWKDLTPQHRKLVGAMLNSPVHIIATVRSKQAYEIEEYTDSKGNRKQKPVKIGLAPVQREGMEYEFTVFFDIDQKHNANSTKDRTNMFKDEVFTPDEKTGERLLAWLNSGKDNPELDPDLPKKHRIKNALLELGVNAANKEEYETAVHSLTSLALIPENFEEIIVRLDILVHQKAEAAAEWNGMQDATEPQPVQAGTAPEKPQEVAPEPETSTLVDTPVEPVMEPESVEAVQAEVPKRSRKKAVTA